MGIMKKDFIKISQRNTKHLHSDLELEKISTLSGVAI
jgi:hypothetical protein